MSDILEPSTAVSSVGEWLYSSLLPIIISVVISISFMVGEILVHNNLSPETQFIINCMSDILLGPFAVITFLYSGSFR